MDNYPDNKPGSFTNQLSSAIDLGSDACEAALSKLIFPKTWDFLSEDDSEIRVVNNAKVDVLKVDKINFDSVNNLIEHLNMKLVSTCGGITFALDKSGMVSITCNSNISIQISEKLQAILGLNTKNVLIKKLPKDIRKTYYEFASNKPDLAAGMQAVFIYTDIVDSQVVGDTKAPLLSIVPTEGDFYSHIAFEPRTLDFIPLRSNRIYSVSVSIRDVAGKVVQFSRGMVFLTLQIRKRQIEV